MQNFIIGDIHVAAQAAQQQAITEGFDSEILDLQIKGEAREVGLHFAKKLKEEKQKREKSVLFDCRWRDNCDASLAQGKLFKATAKADEIRNWH